MPGGTLFPANVPTAALKMASKVPGVGFIPQNTRDVVLFFHVGPFSVVEMRRSDPSCLVKQLLAALRPWCNTCWSWWMNPPRTFSGPILLKMRQCSLRPSIVSPATVPLSPPVRSQLPIARRCLLRRRRAYVHVTGKGSSRATSCIGGTSQRRNPSGIGAGLASDRPTKHIKPRKGIICRGGGLRKCRPSSLSSTCSKIGIGSGVLWYMTRETRYCYINEPLGCQLLQQF